MKDATSVDSDRVADVWGDVRVKAEVSSTGYSGESEADSLVATGSGGIDSSGGDRLKTTGCEGEASLLSDVACCDHVHPSSYTGSCAVATDDLDMRS